MQTRIALLGLGAAARQIHLPAYRRLGVQVVGGCDTDPAARTRAEAEWGLRTFAEPQAMIQATRPDIVSILTPPDHHVEHCQLALSAGCHVFCEKPVAPTLQEVDALLAAAESAGRRFVVNNQFRFMNIFRTARRLVGSEELGEILFARLTQSLPPHDNGEPGWRGRLERRVCYEFGSHVFDTLRYLFGCEPVRLFAHMPHPSPGVVSDAINVVVLEFPGERSAAVVLDRLNRGPERYFDLHLTGERATLSASIGGRLEFAVGLQTRRLRPFARLSLVRGAEARLCIDGRSRRVATDPVNPLASATAANLRDFIQALEQGREPECSLQRNRGSALLVFKAYESAESGRPVEL